MDPADLYTGIVAELHAPLRSTARDAAPYVDLVERYGGPALELGCGDGDPLLDLRRHGLGSSAASWATIPPTPIPAR